MYGPGVRDCSDFGAGGACGRTAPSPIRLRNDQRELGAGASALIPCPSDQAADVDDRGGALVPAHRAIPFLHPPPDRPLGGVVRSIQSLVPRPGPGPVANQPMPQCPAPASGSAPGWTGDRRPPGPARSGHRQRAIRVGLDLGRHAVDPGVGVAHDMGKADLLVEPGGVRRRLEPVSIVADEHGRPDHVRDLVDPGRQGRGLAVLQEIDGQREALHGVAPSPHRHPLARTFDARQVRAEGGDEDLPDRNLDGMAAQPRHAFPRRLHRVIDRALAQGVAEGIEHQRHGAVAQTQDIEHDRHAAQPGRGVAVPDPRRIDPEGVAAADTAVAPDGGVIDLRVAQRLGHRLVELEVLPPAAGLGTGGGLGELGRIDGREDELEAHGGAPAGASACRDLSSLRLFYRLVNSHHRTRTLTCLKDRVR